MNCSPSGSSVHGILQARLLNWVAVPSSRGSSPPRDQTHVSYLCLLHCQAGSLPLAPPGKQGAYSCKLPWKLEFDNLLCRFFIYSHMKTIWDWTHASWSSCIGGRIQGEAKFSRFLHLGGLVFPWKPGTHLSPPTAWSRQSDKYLRGCPGGLLLPLLPGKGPAGGPRAEAPLWRHS